ncbi:type II secretion system F family protein [Nesterenkonia sp. DZ6]|uniref:type II secretion system F family protein n=1 Tax=Nesterenkonia sp. DZ6 TaxID=2901229 RepID=UPI001F4CA4CC|nr:hypothetical protein [Nesterenkonia sp. DZ6]MCH8561529.1 hypothetical protein [Nesterenkonia sp. DZ6]
MPLLLLLCVAAAAASAALLGVPPRGGWPRRALRPPKALLIEVLPREVLRTASLRGGRFRAERSADDLGSSACSLLHQYAALLQSGRSQAQAWADLGTHWRSRETTHPLTQVCELAAAAEQAGLGAVVGLRRSLASVTASQRRRAGRTMGNFAPARSSATTTVVLTEVLERLISIHALSQSTGAPLSALCRKAADALEDSAALEAAVRTAAAGPRLTQFILAALPLGGLAMGALMGADPFAVLLGSALGWGCLVVGLGSLLLGWRWSTRMIRAVGKHG